MKLFFQLLHFDIRTELLASVLFLALIGSMVVYFVARDDRCRKVVLLWLSCVFFLMLYAAVIARTRQDSYSWQLIPFWSYSQIREGYIETLYENIFNVLFFIPYGFLSGAFFRKNGFVWSVALGASTSIIIELTQLITRTGVCETDDVIHNTLGCVVGYLSCRLLRLLYRFLFS
jgi:glycopeptide antibiotics resistance protein